MVDLTGRVEMRAADGLGRPGDVYLYVASPYHPVGAEYVKRIDLSRAAFSEIKELRLSGDLAEDGTLYATRLSGDFAVGGDIRCLTIVGDSRRDLADGLRLSPRRPIIRHIYGIYLSKSA